MEQHMRQAKEEEEFLIAMNKKGREDLLKAISEVGTCSEITADQRLMMGKKSL